MNGITRKHTSKRKITLLVSLAFAIIAGGTGGLVYAANANDIQLPQAVQATTDQTTPYVEGGPSDPDPVHREKAKAKAEEKKAEAAKTAAQQSAGAPAANQQPAAQAPAAASQAPAQPSAASSNLRGLSLYVDPARAALPAPLGSSPVAAWFGNWNANVQADTNAYVSAAAARGQVATLVAYNIPGRDCGSYSAGGAGSADAYRAWIRQFAAGIGGRQAIVILEPDALAQITDCLDAGGQAQRYSLLSDAVSVLAGSTRAFVYLDAGHSGWVGSGEMAARLGRANVSGATGFSLNVSNFETTANNTAYGNAVTAKTGKHFIIDTSRNGNGPGGGWCNPSGRALGASPTTATTGNVDAYLWIKVPGESDGTCNGGPSAGSYWSDYANGLIANRR